jgi:hypothetical protein
MTNQPQKVSIKSQQLWNRFETSGSIQAYLRFRQARQAESADVKPGKTESGKAPLVKRSAPKAAGKGR